MKKMYFLFIALLSVTLLLSACGENKDSNVTGDSGQILVLNNCTDCHGIGLEGSTNFPPIDSIGGKYSKKEILEIIKKGRGKMPAGVIKGNDASKAAEYLSGLK